MLSKSAAKTFFIVGTVICTGSFVLLTLDTIKRVPGQTNAAGLTESVKRGKHLWESNNCMGCHTIMGEGAYYAPELTKVFQRRGAPFIKAMLTDPELMYPNQRKMVKYKFSDPEKDDLVAFLKWIGEVDLNGFPARPTLGQVAVSSQEALPSDQSVALRQNRPQVFNQMCIACHALGGQGGVVGPALDGIGDRRDQDYIARWLHNPEAVKPEAKMPKLPLSEADITELTAYLSQLKQGR